VATVIRLDTHVVAWLYAGELSRFSDRALDRIDHDELVVSPIVTLELTYLHEIGRLTVPGQVIVDDLADRVGLTSSTIGFDAVVTAALPLGWTRDPFDRLIAADAIAAAGELLTRDEQLHRHVRLAVW
jgi:PIN domain nuclease of toxin-antitoxin system